MKITEDVRKYAAEQGLSEDQAITHGMKEKAAAFVASGKQLYAQARKPASSADALVREVDEIAITTSNVGDFKGDLALGAGDLPFDIWRVFSQPAGSQIAPVRIVPVSQLVSGKNQLLDERFLAGLKLDPRQTAFERMVRAGRGDIPGREPLRVKKRSDGRLDVTDGNATAQVLMLVGWSEVPVVLSD